MAAPNQMIVARGGEYFNKGFYCLWVEGHDGTTYKFIVTDPETAAKRKVELPDQLTIPRPLAPVTDESQST